MNKQLEATGQINSDPPSNHDTNLPSEETWKPKKLFNLRFIHLVCIETVLQFGLYLMNPIVSNYAVFLGATISAAGFVGGLSATSAIVARPISGVFADILSKKSQLVFSCILFFIGALGCASSSSVLLLGVFRVVQGLSFAFKSVVISSMVSLVVPSKSIGSGVGLLGLSFTVACALGPACSSSVAAMLGYQASFVLSGVLFAIALILSICFKAPQSAGSHHRKKNLSAQATSNTPDKTPPNHILVNVLMRMVYFPAVPYAVVMALFVVPQGTMTSMLLLTGEVAGVENLSVYYVIFALAALVSRPLSGRISDSVGLHAILIPMMALVIIGMVALACSFSLTTAIIAALCMGIGHGAVNSTVQAECMRGVNANKVGRAANTFYLGVDIGMGIGPFVSGFVLEFFGVPAAFGFCALTVVVALAMFLLFERTEVVKNTYRSA